MCLRLLGTFWGCFNEKRKEDTEAASEKFPEYPESTIGAPMKSLKQLIEAKKHVLYIEIRKLNKDDKVVGDYGPELLMKEFNIDRHDAARAITSSRNVKKVREECQRMALEVEEKLRARSDEGILGIPTWDTRHPPNITPKTRVLAVLGITEETAELTNASPAPGDGWIVSDFYLWLHLLRGLGFGQEWISCIEPKNLLDKYKKETKVGKQEVETCKRNDNGEQDLCETKPFQTKCADGLLHGDEFETRAVVLDENSLNYAERKVDVGPKGVKLRDHFLERLRQTLALAAAYNEHVLIMLFAQGSLEPKGGMALGVEIEQGNMSNLLSSDQVSLVLQEFPGVDVSLYMTSCYSGHWITTPIFKFNEDGQWSSPDLFWLPNAKNWSPARRHAQAITSKAALRKSFQMEPVLSDNVDMDTVRDFHKTSSSIVANMYRLCLPGKVEDHGSTPRFTEKDDMVKSWRSEASYKPVCFERNYNSLRKVEPISHQQAKLQPKFRDTKDEQPDWEVWSAEKLFEGNYAQLSCGYGCTARGITSLTNARYLSGLYRSVAEALDDNSNGKGHFLSSIYESLRSGQVTMSDIFRARREFIYRLDQHKFAQDYADSLNLYQLPSIDSWKSPRASKPNNPTDAEDARTTDGFVTMLTSPSTSPFATPEFPVGLHETKHIRYFASSMAAAKYTADEAKKGLEKIQAKMDGWMYTDFLAWRYMGSSRFMNATRDARVMLRN